MHEGQGTQGETIRRPLCGESGHRARNQETARQLVDALKKDANESALDVQVGGSHYKQFKIQPIEFIQRNGIPFIEGNIIKYTCRRGSKNGPQDIEKVKHYCDLLLDLCYPNRDRKVEPTPQEQGYFTQHELELAIAITVDNCLKSAGSVSIVTLKEVVFAKVRNARLELGKAEADYRVHSQS